MGPIACPDAVEKRNIAAPVGHKTLMLQADDATSVYFEQPHAARASLVSKSCP
jgi:hypothetical protein